MNKILDSTRFVVSRAKHVQINENAAQKWAERFEPSTIGHWKDQSPVDFSAISKDEALHFILAFNALAFCFWGDPKWSIEYNGKVLGGSFSLMAAFARAHHEGIPIFDPVFWAKMSNQEWENITRSNTPIPLARERLEILQEIGNRLVRKYEGRFSVFLDTHKGNIDTLLTNIVNEFPSFQDRSMYEGLEISFYKRAQLMISDLVQIFPNEYYIPGNDLSSLTAFSDYKLPMILRREGVLDYTPELASKVDQKVELKHNSPEEVEIRSATIQAMEKITQNVRSRFPNVKTVQVNDAIWLASQTKSPLDKPYHRTRTTAY